MSIDFILQQLISGLAIGMAYALIAIGYSMVYGILKFINFGHGAVYMAGTYMGYFIWLFFLDYLPIWPAFLIVIPVQPEPIFTNSDGGPWSYEAEFLDGLLPWVDDHYRTEAHPEGRALAGISRGGIWALEIALRNADQMDAMAALSPALAVNYAREDYDPFNLAVSGRPLPSRIYLAAGQEDWARPDTERLHGVLQSVGADPRLVIVPGSHGSDLWQGLLEDVIGYLALDWADTD